MDVLCIPDRRPDVLEAIRAGVGPESMALDAGLAARAVLPRWEAAGGEARATVTALARDVCARVAEWKGAGRPGVVTTTRTDRAYLDRLAAAAGGRVVRLDVEGPEAWAAAVAGLPVWVPEA